MNTSILVMEDDVNIQELIVEFLKAEGYDVDYASDGLEGIQLFKKKEYDLVLLDIMMPNLDGYSVCKMIRQTSNVPIIFLTALNEESNQLKGFELECDDYITKPFSPQVLVAKIQAILRRTYSYNNDLKSDVIKFKDITLNIVEGKLYFKGENVDLTKNELKIMNILMSNQEKIVSREEIIEELWDTDEFISENTLTVNVNRLRKKLNSIGLEDVIETKKGQGYIIR